MGLKRNPDGTYEVPIRDRKQPDDMQGERIVVSAILICTVLLVIFGSLLLILPTFRITRIEVRGNRVTPTDAIIAASGVSIGDETFSVNTEKLISRIYDSPECSAIRSVSVRRAFRTVTIVVEDGDVVMASSYGSYHFTFDRDLRVTQILEEADAFSDCVRVTLPWAAVLCEGEILDFTVSGIDRTYITELLGELERSGEWGRVSAIDVSRKFSVSYDRDGHIRIVLGSVSGFSEKRALAEEVLALRNPGAEDYVVIDVSDTEKITYRTVTQADFGTGAGG